MRITKLIKRIGIVIPILFSCSSKIEHSNLQFENENKNNRMYRMNLKKTGTKQWNLDSVTIPYFHSAFYNPIDSTLSYISNHNLIQCNLNNTNQTRKSIPFNLSNFTIKDDTVIGIDYASNRLLFYHDSVAYSKTLPQTAKYSPLPLTGISPVITDNNYVSFFGEIAGEPLDEDSINRPVFAHIDRRGNQDTYSLGYPEIYREANWGGGILWWVYADYVPDQESYIISFPISHSLYIYNPATNEVGSFYAGSKDISGITAYSNDKTYALTTEESLKFVAETSSYANIFYDPWRKVYYRIAEFGIPYNEKNKGMHKPISVIILNDKLNKIGETRINNPGRNFRYGCFVSHLGLMIPKDTVEDLLLYEIYTPENIPLDR